MKMFSKPREIHVMVDREIPATPHIPSMSCWCAPKATLRDVATGEPVVRHKTPPNPPRRPRPEAEGGGPDTGREPTRYPCLSAIHTYNDPGGRHDD